MEFHSTLIGRFEDEFSSFFQTGMFYHLRHKNGIKYQCLLHSLFVNSLHLKFPHIARIEVDSNLQSVAL